MYTFNIEKLMKLTEKDKYAATVAAFNAIDLIDQIEDPQKKNRKRKVTVQVMDLLADEDLKWAYVSDEDRLSLENELGDREREHTQAMARGARYGQLIEKEWDEAQETTNFDSDRKPTAEEIAEFKDMDNEDDDESDLGEEITGYDHDAQLLKKTAEKKEDVAVDSPDEEYDYYTGPAKKIVENDSDLN